MAKMLRAFVLETYGAATAAERFDAAEQLAPEASHADRARLALTQLLLPDLVDAIEQVIVAADDRPTARAFAGGVLTYVYNPLDLIGDDSPLGLLDDTIICALGLNHMARTGDIELDSRVAGMCELAADALPLLNADLREGIEDFVRDLALSTAGSAPSP